MTLIKSYFGRVTAQPGKLLTGGVRQNVSSRFAERADAVAWVRAIRDVEGFGPRREVCPSFLEPEIAARSCDTVVDTEREAHKFGAGS